eukprot:scaffold182745_cov28-Tisochrysis_lutea.AAC.2
MRAEVKSAEARHAEDQRKMGTLTNHIRRLTLQLQAERGAVMRERAKRAKQPHGGGTAAKRKSPSFIRHKGCTQRTEALAGKSCSDEPRRETAYRTPSMCNARAKPDIGSGASEAVERDCAQLEACPGTESSALCGSMNLGNSDGGSSDPRAEGVVSAEAVPTVAPTFEGGTTSGVSERMCSTFPGEARNDTHHWAARLALACEGGPSGTASPAVPRPPPDPAIEALQRPTASWIAHHAPREAAPPAAATPVDAEILSALMRPTASWTAHHLTAQQEAELRAKVRQAIVEERTAIRIATRLETAIAEVPAPAANMSASTRLDATADSLPAGNSSRKLGPSSKSSHRVPEAWIEPRTQRTQALSQSPSPTALKERPPDPPLARESITGVFYEDDRRHIPTNQLKPYKERAAAAAACRERLASRAAAQAELFVQAKQTAAAALISTRAPDGAGAKGSAGQHALHADVQDVPRPSSNSLANEGGSSDFQTCTKKEREHVPACADQEQEGQTSTAPLELHCVSAEVAQLLTAHALVGSPAPSPSVLRSLDPRQETKNERTSTRCDESASCSMPAAVQMTSPTNVEHLGSVNQAALLAAAVADVRSLLAVVPGHDLPADIMAALPMLSAPQGKS